MLQNPRQWTFKELSEAEQRRVEREQNPTWYYKIEKRSEQNKTHTLQRICALVRQSRSWSWTCQIIFVLYYTNVLFMSCKTIVIISCCLDNQLHTVFSADKLNLISMHVNTLTFPNQKYSYSKVSWLWIFLSLNYSPLHFLFLLTCAYLNAQPKPLFF